MASFRSQYIAFLLATVVSLASAGLGPSTDGNWNDNDVLAYSVVVGVGGAVLIVAIMLYCQLLYFQRVGKIESEAQRSAEMAIAKKEAEQKSKEIAAQKEKAKRDIAAQKAKQKTK